jgi:hypothetical protein
MHSRQIEQLATQHTTEAQSSAMSMTAPTRPGPAKRPTPRQIRQQTGWALVSIGLRLAESGTR